MKQYTPTVVLLVVILSASLLGYSKLANDRPVPTEDRSLRLYMGVSSIGGDYTLPDGDNALLTRLLTFENGKLTRTFGASAGNTEGLPTRTMRVELLSGEYEGKPRVVMVNPFGASLEQNDDFWKKLDGGWTSFGQGARRPTYDGYEIIGFIQSNLKQDGTTNNSNGGEFLDVIKDRKFVCALAVKSFKTMDEAEKVMRGE